MGADSSGCVGVVCSKSLAAQWPELTGGVTIEEVYGRS
jgi:hypothetical protein